MIPVSKPYFPIANKVEVMRAVNSGWISSIGPYFQKLEHSFESHYNRSPVFVSNGTVALSLALETLGIQANDKVLLPEYTFVASANAVRHIGAIPVFVGCNKATMSMDLVDLKLKLEEDVKAIIVVPLYGIPPDYDVIQDLVSNRDIKVIEDAAEAHFASSRGIEVGTFGDASCFSFYGNKIITSGEGGVILFREKRHALTALHLRDHAMSKTKRYWHDKVGYNYRMTNIQASLLYWQFTHRNKIVSKRKRVFELYSKYLGGKKNLLLHNSVNEKEITVGYWLVTLNLTSCISEDRRDALIEILSENGIDSRPTFYNLATMPMYSTSPLKNEYIWGISLPTYIGLRENQIKKICKIVMNYLER